MSFQLQLAGLKLSEALWMAKSSSTDFSISLFWPVQQSRTHMASTSQSQVKLKSQRKKKRRPRKKHKATAHVKSAQDGIAAQSISTSVQTSPNDAQHFSISNSNLVSPASSDNPDIDLLSCINVTYESKDGYHGVSFCDDSWVESHDRQKPGNLKKSRIRT